MSADWPLTGTRVMPGRSISDIVLQHLHTLVTRLFHDQRAPDDSYYASGLCRGDHTRRMQGGLCSLGRMGNSAWARSAPVCCLGTCGTIQPGGTVGMFLVGRVFQVDQLLDAVSDVCERALDVDARHAW